MLHSFLSSRFYSFTIVGTVAFAVAAVLMMGFLHGKVQQTFLEAMRTRHLQGMSTLCQIGRDTVDKHLSFIRQELRDLAITHGKKLRDADHEQRGQLLSSLTLHTADVETFFFQDTQCSCLKYGVSVPSRIAAPALNAAWNGHFSLIGPYFDDRGKFKLCILEPCFSDGRVIGVLGVQLDGAIVSRWIERLSFQGVAGFTYLFDRNGLPVAASTEAGQHRIQAFREDAELDVQGQGMDILRVIRAAILHKDVGPGGYVLEDGSVHLSYQELAQAPWIFFVGFEEPVLGRLVNRTAEKALQGVILYFVLLVGAILLIVGLTLFDALRNRRLSLLLKEQNATISRQAENLLASERMFRYTLTQCSTQVIDYDVTSRMLTFYSGNQKDVFRVPEGEDWGPLLLRDKDISPEALAEIRALVHDVRSGAARESCDFRLRDKASGKEQWHRLSLSGVGGENGGSPRRLIGIIEDISEAKEAEYDLLTRLYNRKTSEEMIRHQLAVLPSRQPYAFLLLDVDRFKSVNDTFGHPIGDKVLEETAELLRSTFREEDILGRLGGDEFCVFLSGEHLEKSRLEGALTSLHRRAHDILKGPAGESPDVSFSCGAVLCCARHSFEELYLLADEALYRVKEGGRDNFEIVVWDSPEG